jgi:DNA-binding transcriptional ArsR family regulator
LHKESRAVRLKVMRPLIHPSADDITVEAILHALSDPARVAIFAQVVGSECPQSCSDFAKILEGVIPKSTLSQHFKVLRESGLIRSERRGVEMHNTSRCAEIERRFPGLVSAITRAHQIQSGRNTVVRRPVSRVAKSA